MESAGVRRLVCVTGYGAGDSLATMGLVRGLTFQAILGRVYQDKTLQERLIKRSALDWVIARPVILTNGPKTGRYRVLPDRDQWKLGTISRADVADFLVIGRSTTTRISARHRSSLQAAGRTSRPMPERGAWARRQAGWKSNAMTFWTKTGDAALRRVERIRPARRPVLREAAQLRSRTRRGMTTVSTLSPGSVTG